MEPLLDRVLGENLGVELLVGDNQFESWHVFDVLKATRENNEGKQPKKHAKI